MMSEQSNINVYKINKKANNFFMFLFLLLILFPDFPHLNEFFIIIVIIIFSLFESTWNELFLFNQYLEFCNTVFLFMYMKFGGELIFYRFFWNIRGVSKYINVERRKSIEMYMLGNYFTWKASVIHW